MLPAGKSERRRRREANVVILDRLTSVKVKKGLSILLGSIFLLMCPVAVQGADIGGKPEKTAVSIAYVSPSAAFTPFFVAAEAGLFSKYGLNVKSQLLGPAVAQQGLVSEEIDILVDGPLLIPARLGAARVKYFGAYMQRYEIGRAS